MAAARPRRPLALVTVGLLLGAGLAALGEIAESLLDPIVADPLQHGLDDTEMDMMVVAAGASAGASSPSPARAGQATQRMRRSRH